MSASDRIDWVIQPNSTARSTNYFQDNSLCWRHSSVTLLTGLQSTPTLSLMAEIATQRAHPNYASMAYGTWSCSWWMESYIVSINQRRTNICCLQLWTRSFAWSIRRYSWTSLNSKFVMNTMAPSNLSFSSHNISFTMCMAFRSAFRSNSSIAGAAWISGSAADLFATFSASRCNPLIASVCALTWRHWWKIRCSSSSSIPRKQ